MQPLVVSASPMRFRTTLGTSRNVIRLQQCCLSRGNVVEWREDGTMAQCESCGRTGIFLARLGGESSELAEELVAG